MPKGKLTREEGSYTDVRLRVRYAETDQMGVAYHSHYLVWFEVGRSEFCRRHGFSYQEMERSTGRYLVVAEAYCRYRLPLRYDYEFVVRTRLSDLRHRTVTFRYELLDPESDTTYAEGKTVHVVTDQQGRPRSFPSLYRELLGQKEKI